VIGGQEEKAMFPLPYPMPYSAILYALLGLDIALLVGGLALGPLDAAQTGRLPLPVRMGLSLLLVVAAGVQWRLSVAAPGAPYARWVFVGMALGLVGDLVMAGLIPVPSRLIFGMLAFGLGHIAYAVALAGLTTDLGLWSAPLHLAVGAVVAAAAVGLWHGAVQKPGGDRTLNLAALGYSLLMATVNALAIALAVRQARFVPLAVGALLFLTSDLILGNWTIRGHARRRVNDLVWVTYNLGQLLIVFSVAAAQPRG